MPHGSFSLKFAFSAFCGIIHIRYQPFLSIGAKNTQNLVLLRVKPEREGLSCFQLRRRLSPQSPLPEIHIKNIRAIFVFNQLMTGTDYDISVAVNDMQICTSIEYGTADDLPEAFIFTGSGKHSQSSSFCMQVPHNS